MLNEIKIGPRRMQDGSTGEARGGQYSEAIISQAHGKYYEAGSRKRLFFAANQAAKTWSVALHTTHTGLMISNPRGSSVDVVIVRVGFAESVAVAGLTVVGLMGGYDIDTDVTHTNALGVYSTFLLGPHGVANVDDQATLPTAPLWIEAYMGAFTTNVLHDTSPVIVDVDGAIVVPPGAYCGIGCLTVATGFGSIMWEEVSR